MIVSLLLLFGFALAVIGAEPDPAPVTRVEVKMTPASKIKLRANPTLRELTESASTNVRRPGVELAIDRPQALLE